MGRKKKQKHSLIIAQYYVLRCIENSDIILFSDSTLLNLQINKCISSKQV